MGDTKENGNSKEEKGLATEIFGMLKRVLFFQWIVIGVLIAIITAQSFYHDYKWSEFEAVVVDSGEGGYANYIGNDGDINYGESSSAQEEESDQ